MGVTAYAAAFRRRVLTVVVGSMFGAASASGLYVAVTWEQPHRTLLALGTVAVMMNAVALLVLGRRQLLTPEVTNAVVAAMAVGYVVTLSVACVLDGGVTSPYVGTLFIMIALAAVTLDARLVLGFAGLALAAVVVIGVGQQGHDGAALAGLVLLGTGLAVSGAVGATVVGDRAARAAHVRSVKLEIVSRLTAVVEHRDDDTGHHIQRMSAYCEVIGQRLGLTPRACAQLRLAATMHDVGKVAIPDAILHKPGPLTDEERAVMQRHAEEGHEMLAGSGVDTLQLGAVIALHHHERHDGAGYPHGLAGDAIPLPARIAAVADVFDALTSDRVYRPALALEEALELIRAGRGSQFDPEVVDAFFAGLAEVERIRVELSPTAPDAPSTLVRAA